MLHENQSKNKKREEFWCFNLKGLGDSSGNNGQTASSPTPCNATKIKDNDTSFKMGSIFICLRLSHHNRQLHCTLHLKSFTAMITGLNSMNLLCNFRQFHSDPLHGCLNFTEQHNCKEAHIGGVQHAQRNTLTAHSLEWDPYTGDCDMEESQLMGPNGKTLDTPVRDLTLCSQ